MLRKLLKYDLRAIFRIWWIVALVSVGISVLAGFVSGFIDSKANVPELINVAAELLMFFAYFCMAGLTLMTQILLFIRYYRNFFTDEGYLTFTLPVKRETLLNSKVLTGIISIAAAVGVCLLNVFLMFGLRYNREFQLEEFYDGISKGLGEVPPEAVSYLLVYSVEALIIVGLLLVLSVLFLYCCITFGSMIVKKGKLFASIGIYYGATSLFSTAIQLMLILGVGSIAVWMTPIAEQQLPTIVALILLAFILFLAALCALVYAFTHWMLGRKLNLS